MVHTLLKAFNALYTMARKAMRPIEYQQYVQQLWGPDFVV